MFNQILLCSNLETINSDATSVSIGNTSPFNSFGGITTDRGEALIGEEIVSYVVGTGQLHYSHKRYFKYNCDNS